MSTALTETSLAGLLARALVIDLSRPVEAATPTSPHHAPFRLALLRRHGDVVRDGVIAYTPAGTMRVPNGPGLGVELDPDKVARYAEAHRREGDISIYAEDAARRGAPPVKSQW